MSYRINVARLQFHRDGTPEMSFGTQRSVHFFATEVDGSRAIAAEILREIMRAFPADRYAVSITEWRNTGRTLDACAFAEGGEG